jgi:hypothetical protein
LANEFLRIQNRYAGLTFEKIDDPFTEEIWLVFKYEALVKIKIWN